MRRVFVLLFIGIFALTVTSARAQESGSGDRPIPDKWALVIGISQFQDSSMNLQYPAKDATDFYNYLINEAHFAKDHVRLLLNENATRENILSQVGDRWLPRVVAPDDLVVIYISSHGSPSSMDVAGANYVVAHNTDREQLYATGVPMDAFAQMIKARVHTDRVVLILDACHSGSAKTAEKGLLRRHNFDTNALALGEGQLVICSSAPDQVSWESKRYSNGVFTHHLIDSLRKQPKMKESYELLKQQVQNEVLTDRGELQIPALKAKWTGAELVLNTVPSAPRPGMPETPLRKPNVSTSNAAVSTSAVSSSGQSASLPPIQVAANPQIAQRIQRPVMTSGSVMQPASVQLPPPQSTAPTSQSATPAAAPYGEYAGNGKVKMKVLDVDKRMTGNFYTVELQNVSPAVINPSQWLFNLSKDGYMVTRTDGAHVYGGDRDLSPGIKTKLELSSTSETDTLAIKFSKPGWAPISLRTSTEEIASDSQSAPSASVSQPTASYGNYASNGKVQMKVIDTEEKMIGFFATVEVMNNTDAPLDLWYLTFEFYKDGYFVSKTSGAEPHFTVQNLPPGVRTKVTISTSTSGADQLQIKFPKPGWGPLTLQLK